jgi:hypothetical protein
MCCRNTNLRTRHEARGLSNMYYKLNRSSRTVVARRGFFHLDFIMTDQGQARSQPRKYNWRRRSKQEPQNPEWTCPKFGRWRHLSTSSYPYPSSDTSTTPLTPRYPYSLSNAAHILPTSRFAYRSDTAPISPTSSAEFLGEVKFIPEGDVGIQTIQQRRSSFDMKGTISQIPTQNYTVHPYCDPALTSAMEPSLLDDLYDYEEDLLIFGPQRHFAPSAYPRHSLTGQNSHPFIEPPFSDLEEISARVIDDLGACWSTPLLLYLQGAGLKQVSEGYMWLPGQRQRLLEQLNFLSLELRGLEKIDYLKMDDLSLAGDSMHVQAALRPSKLSPEATDLDMNDLYNAKIQLDLYNSRWKEIQAEHTEPSTALFPSIPWPELSPPDNNSFRLRFKIRDTTTQALVWKWATYSFFVSAFGFWPLFERDANNEAKFDFISECGDGTKDKVAKLRELKNQMKLEKVRWHEDKMRVLFGPSAVMSERVKAVWNVVIDLRDRIERELEALQG